MGRLGLWSAPVAYKKVSHGSRHIEKSSSGPTVEQMYSRTPPGVERTEMPQDNHWFKPLYFTIKCPMWAFFALSKVFIKAQTLASRSFSLSWGKDFTSTARLAILWILKSATQLTKWDA